MTATPPSLPPRPMRPAPGRAAPQVLPGREHGFAAQLSFWLHLAWQLALPGLAVLAVHLTTDGGWRAWGWLLLPALLYTVILIRSYRLRVSALSYLLLVLIPGQVALVSLLFGGSFAVFLMELCAVEIGGLMIGVAIGTVRVHYRPSGPPDRAGMAIILIVCAAVAAGPFVALVPALVGAHAAAPLGAVALLLAAMATSAFRHTRTLVVAADAFRASGEEATADFEVGHGDRIVGPAPGLGLVTAGAMAWYAGGPWLLAALLG